MLSQYTFASILNKPKILSKYEDEKKKLFMRSLKKVDDSKFANLAHQSVEFILVGVFLCSRLDCRGPVVVACSFGSCRVAVYVAWQ
ncbi:hypothetical protein P8452_74400 [Trifolium repens]|nr:hypothetical protein P8452_74400 [Trifolium repens]